MNHQQLSDRLRYIREFYQDKSDKVRNCRHLNNKYEDVGQAGVVICPDCDLSVDNQWLMVNFPEGLHALAYR